MYTIYKIDIKEYYAWKNKSHNGMVETYVIASLTSHDRVMWRSDSRY